MMAAGRAVMMADLWVVLMVEMMVAMTVAV